MINPVNIAEIIRTFTACNSYMGELVRGQTTGVESLTTMLVSEIAEQEGVEPIQLSPPIRTTIDIDALEKIFGDNEGFVRVEFTYSGHQITIESGEELQVE